MSSRRQIRTATVQVLYASGSGGDPAGGLEDPSLELILEPLRAREVQARAKALVHLQQGREATTGPSQDLLRRLSRLEVVEGKSDLSGALHTLHDAEEEILDTLDQLRRELHGNKSPEHLSALLEACRAANFRTRTAAARVRAAEPDLPALQSLREDALKAWDDLQELSDRIEAALAPDPDHRPECKGIAAAGLAITVLGQEVRSYLQGLRKHLPEIDARIEAAVEHYTPERIDRVDRAILRLGAYELLHDPEVPPGVAINEAIELARALGTSDSPRFVNGVLDRIRKRGAHSESKTSL